MKVGGARMEVHGIVAGCEGLVVWDDEGGHQMRSLVTISVRSGDVKVVMDDCARIGDSLHVEGVWDVEMGCVLEGEDEG